MARRAGHQGRQAKRRRADLRRIRNGSQARLLGSASLSNTADWIQASTNIWTSQVAPAGAQLLTNPNFDDPTWPNNVSIGTSWAQHELYFRGKATDSSVRVFFFLGTSAVTRASLYIDSASVTGCDEQKRLVAEVGNLLFDGGQSVAARVWNEADLIADDQRVLLDSLDVAYMGGAQWQDQTRLGNGIELWDGAIDVIVQNNRVSQAFDTAFTSQGTGVTNVVSNVRFLNNLAVSSEQCFELWNRPSQVGQASTTGLTFAHNTCLNAGPGWSHVQRPVQDGSDL